MITGKKVNNLEEIAKKLEEKGFVRKISEIEKLTKNCNLEELECICKSLVKKTKFKN